ncbi:MAG: alpha/beta fold hydrolase [Lysobacterales bacterium]
MTVETAVEFGKQTTLRGMLCQPPKANRRPVGVLILNAGLIHRAGPARMNTLMARRFAEQGFPVLRLDLSGLGFSLPRVKSEGMEQDNDGDVAEAIDYLQASCGVESVVCIGLCSGAEISHRNALLQDRITGAVFLDGYIFPTEKSRKIKLWNETVRHYASRLFRISHWRRWFAARFGNRSGGEEASDTVIWEPTAMAHDQFAQDLATLIGNGVQLKYIFAGTEMGCYYEEQMADSVPVAASQACSVTHFPEADHIYLLESDRMAMIDCVEAWLVTHFEPAASGQ